MTWHYAAAGERRGPIDDAELDRLVETGAITADTLVWRAGMAEWRPLREARAGLIVAEAAAQAAVVAQVAAQQPAPAPRPAGDAEAEFARVVSEGRRIDALDCLRRGWEMVFAAPGETIGTSALVMVTMIGAGFLPCIGSIAQIIATGPLLAAWYLFFLKRMRGQPTEWGDAFAGFQSPMLTQLVLEYVVVTIVTLIAMVPAFGVGIAAVVGAAALQDMPLPVLVLGGGAAAVVALAAVLYIHVSWMYALPLIIDKHIEFWPAMRLSWRVTSRLFLPLLGLTLLCGLVYLAGLLALCVGVFVAAPVCIAAFACSYEDLFGDRRPA